MLSHSVGNHFTNTESMVSHEESEVLVDLDVGNLCVFKIVRLKSSISRGINEQDLKDLAAQGTQKLINEIYKLPSEYHEHVPVAKLPEPSTVIPREKPLPKLKPLTKWEKFAKTKGILKKKKEKLVWDESSKDWKPQYGYRGVSNQTDWLIEVPDNADPNVDYFGKIKEEKKEKVAKNEYQRLRNLAASQKMKVTNLESVDKADKHQLSRSLAAAKTATASLGRFTDKLPKEKAPKNAMKKQKKANSANKIIKLIITIYKFVDVRPFDEKFKPNIPSSMKSEKENNLKIFEELDKKKPKLDIQEALQRYMTKPLKQPKSEEKAKQDEKKKKAKKNKYVKNMLFRGGKKKGFKKSRQ